MTKIKLLTLFFAALAVVAFSSSFSGVVGVHFSTAKAGTLYLDDFSDGNHADGSPVTWSVSLLQPTTLDASSGGLVISGNENGNPGFAGAADAVDVVIRDVSARTRIRVTGTGESASVLVRTQDVEDTLGYFGGLGYIPEFGGSIAFAGTALTNNQQTFFIPNTGGQVVQLNHDVRSEFTDIQIDAFEDQIDVWVWRAGDAMPAEPQFSVTDTTYFDAGHIRLVAPAANQNLGNDGSAIFDFVHVADMPIHEIPEPAAATLGLIAVGLGIITGRRIY